MERRTTGVGIGSWCVLPLQTGGSTTLSVTGNARVRTGDGASMRRREVKREPIRAPWCRSHRKMNTAAGDTFSPAEVGLRAYTNPPPPNWRRTDVETQQKDAQTHEAAAGEPCPPAEAVNDKVRRFNAGGPTAGRGAVNACGPTDAVANPAAGLSAAVRTEGAGLHHNTYSTARKPTPDIALAFDTSSRRNSRVPPQRRTRGSHTRWESRSLRWRLSRLPARRI